MRISSNRNAVKAPSKAYIQQYLTKPTTQAPYRWQDLFLKMQN